MDNLVIIPEKELKTIRENQNMILKKLEGISLQKEDSSLNFRYIPEEKAKTLLGKKATWFWQQRTQGKLAYSKVGNSIFYLLEDITKMLDDNLIEKF